MKFEEEEIGKSFNSTCEEDVYLRWISSRNKGKWTISRRIIFYFFYRIDTGCLSSTTANIDKRQSYIQRKMFLVESGKINVSQRSYLGYSFVAMR